MSVASHLAVSPSAYDRRIRQFLPFYGDVIAETAAALRSALRPVRRIVDLGIGTGATSAAALRQVPAARIWGLDEDPAMLAVAAVRLRAHARQVTLTEGGFQTTALPQCDAIVATYALHHIRSPRSKLAFYRRCHDALAPGGVIVTGDCFPASTRAAAAGDLEMWLTYLTRACGSRAQARATYRSWGKEDVYVPLAEEQRMLTRAGFAVDVPWRRSPFAVLVGVKPPAVRGIDRR
jgi:SAM-dependent methyltransferase